MPISRRLVAFLAVFVVIAATSAAAAENPVVRLGVLKFGTVAWEAEVIRRHGFDRAEGLRLETVDLATPQAGKIALLGGAVDVIVADWLWVSRQRDGGGAYRFLPYSAAIGALVARPEAGIRSLADLAGKRLGVAGGPLDKSWLLLRAAARKAADLDPAEAAEVVHGAPPLLAQRLRTGDLDAVLIYWHYAARLEAAGMVRVAGVDELARRLGLRGDLPWLGYVVSDSWAEAHPDALAGFYRASQAAKDLMLREDAVWEDLRPRMRADGPAEFVALREGWRAGVPRHWGAAERAAAADLFAVLARVGGPDLVGRSTGLAPGTFAPVEIP